MDGHVLVIGATLLDTKAKPITGLEPGTSNPAVIRNARGGTARNIAENLALLGADVVLISAVGDDITGRRLHAQTAAANVNMQFVQVVAGASTGSYVAILEEDGTLAVALDDTQVIEHITPDYLYRNRALFRNAALIFFDGSLSPHAIETIIYLAEQYKVPVCADPSSTRLAYKLRPHLGKLLMVAPNEPEAAMLLGLPYDGPNRDANLAMVQNLMRAGVKVAVVTMSDFGFVYASGYESGYLPAQYGAIVDSTGTGDAIAAAILFGMLEKLPLVECMRLGAAAAGLTLQSDQTVVPSLTLDLLYEHLSI